MATQRKTDGIEELDSMNMLLWAVGFSIVGLPLVPTGFGYIFCSVAIAFASIGVGKGFTEQRVGLGGLASWLIIGLNAAGMLGYLGYVLVNSSNYWG
jgi:hypothetical protein